MVTSTPHPADGVTHSQAGDDKLVWRNIQMSPDPLILFTPALCFFMSHFECIFGRPKATAAAGLGPGNTLQHCRLHRLIRTRCSAAGSCWSRAKLRQQRAELPT